MLVLNLDDDDLNEIIEEEEEIFQTVVEVRRKRKKRSRRRRKRPQQRRFDDYFYGEKYAYESADEYHHRDYQEYPEKPNKDPYKAPDPPRDHLESYGRDHHDHYVDHDHDFHDLDGGYHGYFATIFRDVSYYPRKPVIRNPRDDRFFPGNEPAGVLGLAPQDIEFIRTRVNDVASYVQGPLPTDHIVIHFRELQASRLP